VLALAALAGSQWQGTAELWLDPLGNDADVSACTVEVDAVSVRYTWAFKGATHHGAITLNDGGGTFTDTFHSPSPMVCRAGASAAPVDLTGCYAAGDGPPWGWRIVVALRPPWDGAPEALVLQMTNVAPWGEDTGAVRMVATRR